MENSGLLLSVLAGIGVLTSLTVQALKKILDEKEVRYSSNILAVVVSVVLTLAGSIGYIIYHSLAVTPQLIVTIIAMMFLSFLTSTVGYDKVVQAIKQLGGLE